MVRSLADRTFQLRLTVGLFAARDGAATGLNSMGFEVDLEIPEEDIPEAPEVDIEDIEGLLGRGERPARPSAAAS